MSYLCVHVDPLDESKITFQIEADANRLVRLMSKGWDAFQLEYDGGAPVVGDELELSAGTEVSRSVQHEVSLNGEVIGAGAVSIATNSE